MSTDTWDDIPTSSGAYQKWEDVGDTVTGDVVVVAVGTDLNGNQVPELVIRTDDGADITVTASQFQLKKGVLELDPRPAVGDRIRIAFARIEKRPGGKTMKHFDIDHKVGGAKGTVAVVEEDTSNDPF